MSDSYFHSDEIRERAVDLPLLRRLYPFLRPYLFFAIFGGILGVMIAALRILYVVVQGWVVADLAQQRRLESGFLEWLWGLFGQSFFHGGSHLLGLGVLFFVVSVLIFLLSVGQQFILQYFGQKVIYLLRTKLFEHMLRLPISYFHRNPVGRLVTRVSNDVQSIQEFVSLGLIDLFRHIFTVVAISVAIPYLSWRLGAIALGILPLVVLVSWVFRYFARRAYRQLRQRISEFNAFMAENIAGMSLIQLCNKQEWQKRSFCALNEDLKRSYLQSVRVRAFYAPTVQFLEGLSLALLLYFGHFYITQRELDIATLSTLIWLLGYYYEPIRYLAEKYNLLQSAMASCERIFRVFDASPDPVLERVSEEVGSWGRDRILSSEICFQGVWFTYGGEGYALEDISFTIRPGETVAVVGHTGAGKSTLIQLLLKFYLPTRGRIEVGGVDLDRISPERWRRYIAVVPQDVFLFRGTILDNICLGDSAVSFERVRRVCREIFVDEFIERLPGGYNHFLEEGARTLSAGQRQLLSFARALVVEPAILVLDEATSLIDTPTERLIQRALGRLLRRRTSIVIAHRLSTIQGADKIVVLHRGRVEEVGDHQTLLRRRGRYYRLHRSLYAPASPGG